ncbi:MazG-like family protein [Nocardioides sp. NPDC023903]|jgi:hypothetical protein|uniref:MazG-like family protein n=1 Tax=Nocardioides sp. NPDC023903 TaxID=3157195 RepID=UPI0033C47E84
MTDATPALLAYLSRWLDESQGDRDAEAVLWGRVAKVSEEAGEAIAALIGATGQNPRLNPFLGNTHSYDDVVEELLDVAMTARSLGLFHEKVGAVAERAGAPT